MPSCGSPGCDCTRKTWHRGNRESFLRHGAAAIRARVVRAMAVLGSTAEFSPAIKCRRGWERITIDGKDALVMVGDGTIYLWSPTIGSYDYPVKKRGGGWYMKELRNYVVNADAILADRRRQEAAAAKEREEWAAKERKRAQDEADRAAARGAAKMAYRAMLDAALCQDGACVGGVSFEIDYDGRAAMKLGWDVTAAQAKAMVDAARACGLAWPLGQRRPRTA